MRMLLDVLSKDLLCAGIRLDHETGLATCPLACNLPFLLPFMDVELCTTSALSRTNIDMTFQPDTVHLLVAICLHLPKLNNFALLLPLQPDVHVAH